MMKTSAAAEVSKLKQQLDTTENEVIRLEIVMQKVRAWDNPQSIFCTSYSFCWYFTNDVAGDRGAAAG